MGEDGRSGRLGVAVAAMVAAAGGGIPHPPLLLLRDVGIMAEDSGGGDL